MNPVYKRAMGCILVISILLTLFPSISSPAYAATATETNSVVFNVTGAYDDGVPNRVKYSIGVADIYREGAAAYQSFSVSYPVTLSLKIPAALRYSIGNPSGIWEINESAGNASFIVHGDARTAEQLKGDLEQIYFTLAVSDVYPDEGSTISISASQKKVTSYIDADGYLHYYEYYSWTADPDNTDRTFRTWLQAYNLAKEKTFTAPNGVVLPGYLCTITSRDEQLQVFNSIAKECGWLGGTRMVNNTDKSKIQDGNSIPEGIGSFDITTGSAPAWYWACGPEAWTVARTPTGGSYPENRTYAYVRKGDHDARGAVPLVFWGAPTYVAGNPAVIAGVYANFNNPRGLNHQGTPGGGVEPNNSSGEYCLQFAFSNGDLWNDYSYNMSNQMLGYYVEYGGYPGDPTQESLGTNIGSIASVELTMPVTVNYRSTEMSGGNYRLITSLGVTEDFTRPGTRNKPFTVSPLASVPAGYTFDGYAFDGADEDRARLTSDAQSNVSGFYSLSRQAVTYLYRPNSYTVLFDKNGGDSAIPLSKPVVFDAPYGALADASRRGYTFGGWYTEQGPGGEGTTDGAEVTAGTAVAEASVHTLFAKWTEKSSYRVIYDYNGGTGLPEEITSVSWTDDGLLPVLPVRGGFLFTGWNVVTNGSAHGVNNTDTYGSLALSDVDSHITLQAQWSAAGAHKVIYRMNGADSNQIPDDVLASADSELTLDAPARAGYVFGGWTVADRGDGVAGDPVDGGDKFSGHAYPGSAYIILEAQWSPDLTMRSVNYNYNYSGSPAEPYATNPGIMPLEARLVPALGGNPTRDGYDFAGWNTKADGSGHNVGAADTYVSLTEEATLTLYAQWAQESASYCVSYDMNGSPDTQIAPLMITPSRQNLLPAVAPTPPPGYDFRGWDVVYNGSKANVGVADSFETLARDMADRMVVLRAQWTAKEGYTVRYNLSGALGTTPADLPTVWNGMNLIPAAEPEKAGDVFAGWSTVGDGSTVNPIFPKTAYSELAADPDTKSITLYALWLSTAQDLFYIKYDFDGGDRIATFPSHQLEIYQSSDRIPLPDDTDMVKAGYTFAGWLVSENGNPSVTTPFRKEDSKTYAVVAAVVSGTNYVKYITVRAQWTPDTAAYTVNYDPNHDGQPPLAETDSPKWTDSGLLPSSRPTRAEYALLGWNTKEDGLGRTVLPGDSYGMLSDLTGATGSVTLYAMWAPAETETYRVFYDIAADGMDDPASITVFSGDSGLLPSGSYTRAGYRLAAWDMSANGVKMNVAASDTYLSLAEPGARSITLRARWVPNEYSVTYDKNAADASGTISPIGSPSATLVHWWTSGLLPGTTFTRTGYTVSGWNTSADGRGTAVAPTTPYSALAANDQTSSVMLFAQWTPKNNFLVDYDLNGGISGGLPDILDKTGVSWTDASLLPEAAITKAGYVLGSWDVTFNGTQTDVQNTHTYGQLAASDGPDGIVLTAQWIDRTAYAKYTVKYDLAGATAVDGVPGAAIPDMQNVDWSAAGLLPANVLTRAGYTFGGWRVSQNGSKTDVRDTDTFGELVTADSAKHITLEARWTRIQSDDDGYVSPRMVKLFPGDGTGQYARRQAGADNKITLPGNIFDAPEGKVLAGWSTTPGGRPAYLPGDVITVGQDALPLYAVWEDALPFGGDHLAYINGYPDATVRPERDITREEVATIFFRLLEKSERDSRYTTSNSFSDVGADRWSNAAISTLAAMGIINGYPDGTFRPQKTITRAEFASICARFDGKDFAGADKFGDIAGSWYTDLINRAAERGWVKGYGDGSFRPGLMIRRAEVVTAINRMLQRCVTDAGDMLPGMKTWSDNMNTSAWYYLDMQEATNSHDYMRKDDALSELWTELREDG